MSERRRRERQAWAFVAVVLVASYAIPLATAGSYHDDIGDLSGYVTIAWLGFVLLMPTLARVLGGRFRLLMTVRKELGMGAGFSVVLHGLFAWLVSNDGDWEVLNPKGQGSGWINFALAIVLLVTSIDRVRLSMRRSNWTLHQRVGAFALLGLGSTAATSSTEPMLTVAALGFTASVFAVRALQFLVDRGRYERAAIARNAVGFVLVGGYIVACRVSHEFVGLTAVLAVTIAVLMAPKLVRRARAAGG